MPKPRGGRRRKHPNRALIVYRYWARPIGEIPPVLWETAQRMRELWNQLVVVRDAFSAVIADEGDERALDLQASGLEAETSWRVNSRTSKESWRGWNGVARELVARSGLNWECGPAVLDRFTAACVAAAKGQREWPHVHARLEKINIPHRFTGGGIPWAGLFSPRASRISLGALPPAWAWRDNSVAARRARLIPPHADAPHPRKAWCRFGLDGDATLRFRLLMHRPLPPDAIVKQVSWTGRRHVTKGWLWAVTVTLEQEREQRLPASRTCGLDLGWRRFPEYLRIGMLYDSDGRSIELRLPLDAPTAHSRRHRIESGWVDLLDIDNRIGKHVDATKDLLRLVSPDHLPPSLDLVRQGGLVRRLRTIEQTGAHSDQDVASLQVLRAWLTDNDRWRSRRMALWDRLIGRRRWLYRNLAAWLCQTYGTIAWEGNLGIKQMAEDEDKNPALSAADKARQIAAIGEFRVMLKHAATKIGTRLLDVSAAKTTITCAECGAEAQPSATVEITCPVGHTWDQDVNAARNLFSQIYGQRERSGELRSRAGSGAAEPLVIPDALRAVAVVVHPG